MKTLKELRAMGFIPHHSCAICGEIIGWYAHEQDPAPWFDTGCGCGCSGGGHYDTWEKAFKWYNREYEKESIDAVNAAWERETGSIPIADEPTYAAIKVNYSDIEAHMMAAVRAIPAVRDAMESHKSTWIPGSKGGEPNHN